MDPQKEAGDDLYDNILIHVYRANVRRTREKLETAMKLVQPSGTISVYIQHLNGEFDGSNFSSELAGYVNEVLAADWIGYRITARFAGGRVKRQLRRTEGRLFQYLVPSSILRVPLLIGAVVLWPFIAALTAANNFRLRNRSDLCPEYCSSALLSVTKAPIRHDDAPQTVPAAEELRPAWAHARGSAVGVDH
jgi:hypothetical protein